MTINSIGPIDPIQPENKAGRLSRASRPQDADSISISVEAQERAELLRVREMVAAAPDSRPERIAELRERINDPA